MKFFSKIHENNINWRTRVFKFFWICRITKHIDTRIREKYWSWQQMKFWKNRTFRLYVWRKIDCYWRIYNACRKKHLFSWCKWFHWSRQKHNKREKCKINTSKFLHLFSKYRFLMIHHYFHEKSKTFDKIK